MPRPISARLLSALVRPAVVPWPCCRRRPGCPRRPTPRRPPTDHPGHRRPNPCRSVAPAKSSPPRSATPPPRSGVERLIQGLPNWPILPGQGRSSFPDRQRATDPTTTFLCWPSASPPLLASRRGTASSSPMHDTMERPPYFPLVPVGEKRQRLVLVVAAFPGPPVGPRRPEQPVPPPSWLAASKEPSATACWCHERPDPSRPATSPRPTPSTPDTSRRRNWACWATSGKPSHFYMPAPRSYAAATEFDYVST